MVKAASHHGLDRKYKPWRRGKSQNAKGKKGSLKQQLRGLRRLLPKAHDEAHRAKIQAQIDELETQIGDKQKVEQQKQNARKSHGVRFLERQRLTRLWQQAAKMSDKTARQREQHRLGLDMLYVAHYPLEVRYQPLFRKKDRIILDGRNLARRAAARGKILRQAKTLERANWVPAQVYDDCPTEWSNAKERDIFGVVVPSSETNPVVNDNRFNAAPDSHSALLQAAAAMDAELDAEEEAEKQAGESMAESVPARTAASKQGDDSDDDSSSEGIVSDDDDEDSDGADPLQSSSTGEKRHRVEDLPSSKEEKDAKLKSTEDNVSDDDSSSSSDSSSDSSSSDDSDDDEKPPASQSKKSQPVAPKADEDQEEDDDFLMSGDTNSGDIFANAKEHIPSVDESRGDKSQGWATQRQRPGQFKKRRTRH